MKKKINFDLEIIRNRFVIVKVLEKKVYILVIFFRMVFVPILFFILFRIIRTFGRISIVISFLLSKQRRKERVNLFKKPNVISDYEEQSFHKVSAFWRLILSWPFPTYFAIRIILGWRKKTVKLIFSVYFRKNSSFFRVGFMLLSFSKGESRFRVLKPFVPLKFSTR